MSLKIFLAVMAILNLLSVSANSARLAIHKYPRERSPIAAWEDVADLILAAVFLLWASMLLLQ